MRHTFTYTLSVAEAAKCDAFTDAHEKLHGPCQAAAGGRFGWEFSPCGLGVATTIICYQCKKRENITEYDAW